MYKIHDFDDVFFLLATVAMKTEGVTSPSFHSNHCKGNIYFHHNHAAHQSNLYLTQKKFVAKVYLLSHC